MSPDARSASPAVDKGGSANPFGNVFSRSTPSSPFVYIVFFVLACVCIYVGRLRREIPVSVSMCVDGCTRRGCVDSYGDIRVIFGKG